MSILIQCSKRRSLLLSKTLNTQSPVLTRYLATTSNDDGGDDDDEKRANVVKQRYLSEDVPPIPPYKGFQGNDYTKANERIKKIESQFRYGIGPRMKKVFVKGPPVIRMHLANNCANRPFYRVVLQRNNLETYEEFIEDLGSFDPMPNKDNNIVVALNFERIKYHMGRGIMLKGTISKLLGLSGFLPTHPQSYIEAFKNRQKLEELEKAPKKEEEEKKAAATA